MTRSTSRSTSSRPRVSRAAGSALAAGLLWLLLAPSSATAAVRVISTTSCEGQRCDEVAVRCADLPDRLASVRRFQGKGERGTVIFTSGGNGRGRYNKLPVRRRTQNDLLLSGFEVFQIEWLGDEGWITDAWGSGFARATCAYAELVRWIAAERATNPEVICAQGNSGGSIQSSYGLAVHGLEDLLDMVVMSGGPPVTRIDRYCFGDPDKRRPLPAGEPPRRVASTGRTLVDQVMGWAGVADHCKRVDETPPAEALQWAQRDSLVPPFGDEPRDFAYPRTKLNFVESEGDPAARQGRIYFEAVETEKAWYPVPGDVHSVDNTEAGSAKIVELFETDCTAR